MKVNVVTGGGSGIGLEVAKAFSRDQLVIITGTDLLVDGGLSLNLGKLKALKK